MTEFLQQFELAIVIPLLAGLLVLLFRNHASLRDASSLLIAVLLFIFTAQLLGSEQQNISHTLFTITPGLSLSFHIEPLGLMFALLASSLWISPRFIRLVICAAIKKRTKLDFIYSLHFLSQPQWESRLRPI